MTRLVDDLAALLGDRGKAEVLAPILDAVEATVVWASADKYGQDVHVALGFEAAVEAAARRDGVALGRILGRWTPPAGTTITEQADNVIDFPRGGRAARPRHPSGTPA